MVIPSGDPPAGLEGRWGFDLSDFSAISDFEDPLPEMRRVSLALAETLHMELVFGAREVAMWSDMHGERVRSSAHYRVIQGVGPALEVKFGDSKEPSKYSLSISGDKLLISGAVGVTRLRRLAAGVP